MADHKELLGIATTQNANGHVYVFALWAHSSGIRRYQLDIDILSNPDDKCGFPIDWSSLPRLTVWFSTAEFPINEYEGSLPRHGDSNAAA
jgi:hypothetical protein